MPTARLLPTETAAGPRLMAGDEALLAAAVAGQTSLRFYTWAEPTLSLGYFQPFADRVLHPASACLPVVRRATGGGALVHHHELTYALALPAGAAWQPPGVAWACRMHDVIRAALAAQGVAVNPAVCGVERPARPFLCFQHHTPGDLVRGTDKVVGSAQRRQRGALLQHGSILLGRSAHAPELPGVAVSAVALADDIVRLLDWQFEPVGWSTTERTLLAELEQKYASDEWTHKR